MYATAADAMLLNAFYEDSSCTLEATAAAIRQLEDFAPAPPPPPPKLVTEMHILHDVRATL